MVNDDDTLRRRQNVDIEGSNPLLGFESQDAIGNNEEMIFEHNVTFGVKGLQAEANAMLNPEWSLSLDDSAVIQSTEQSDGMDHFFAGLLEPMFHAQYVDLGHQLSPVQHAGHAYLPGTGPKYNDVGGSVSTSHQNVTVPSQAESNTMQQLETANDSTMLALMKSPYSIPVPTPGEVPKRVGKRKRIKNALSHKKPCLTPSHRDHNDAETALKNNMSSKLTLRSEAAKTFTTDSNMSSKQPGQDYAMRNPRIESIPAWERGNDGRNNFDDAGIVRDIRVLDSERRPMSWPHRNPWRKSLDISVAVLTKGFDKLMTERREASSSAF